MCIVPVVIIILYAGLALGPLLAGNLDEICRNSSGKEDKEKENS